MNRAIVMGIAIFFAMVGIALIGGEKQAVAGHACHGCHGAIVCDGGYVCGGGYACGGCGGYACQGAIVACGGCHGRVRQRRVLFRHHRRNGCYGACAGVVCGGVACYGGCQGIPVTCCGTVIKSAPVIQKSMGPIQKGGAMQKAAAVQKGGAIQQVTYRQVPASYYRVTFRR